MRLQCALTMNSPRSLDIAAIQDFGGGGGSPDSLTRMDVLTALGFLQGRERTGLALMYAKYTKDKGEHRVAAAEVAKVASKLILKAVGKVKGRAGGVLAKTMADLVVMEYARTADTPGAKCRCGGSGLVADQEKAATAKPNAKLEDLCKTCDRCKGTGMKPIPASRVYRALGAITPELAERTYYRHWAPIYEELLQWCHEQEGRAEMGYRRLTMREAA